MKLCVFDFFCSLWFGQTLVIHQAKHTRPATTTGKKQQKHCDDVDAGQKNVRTSVHEMKDNTRRGKRRRKKGKKGSEKRFLR